MVFAVGALLAEAGGSVGCVFRHDVLEEFRSVRIQLVTYGHTILQIHLRIHIKQIGWILTFRNLIQLFTFSRFNRFLPSSRFQTSPIRAFLFLFYNSMKIKIEFGIRGLSLSFVHDTNVVVFLPRLRLKPVLHCF